MLGRWSVALVLMLLVPLAVAQGPVTPPDPEQSREQFYNFEMEVEQAVLTVPTGQLTAVPFTFRDMSQDDSDDFTGGTVPVGSDYFLHYTTFTAQVVSGDPAGWTVASLPSLTTRAGEVRQETIGIIPQLSLDEPYMELLVTARMQDLQSGITVTHNLTLAFLTPGIAGFNALPRGSIQLSPSDTAQMAVELNHFSLLPRSYEAEVVENPCGVGIVPFPSMTFDGKERRVVEFTVQAPEERFWYFTQDCSIALKVYPTDDPENFRRVPLSIVVNGGYVDPTWIFWTVGAVLAIILLVLFVRDRKARIEEELLGKPQKPWTIPVEKVYLDHLKERDPRAHYVVRHYLMEEEYASSLLWYKDFKKATAGTRSKERIVVSQERKVERLRKRWDRRTARPLRKADRLEAKLQKKLDRQGKKGLRKQRRKWRKTTKKMEAAFEAKVKKATEKWEKQAKRAQKKDKPVPEKPVFKDPAYPPEPTGDRLLLADHKWNRKAERFRAKQVKKQGNIEVRAEKKEARLLRKVQKRVERVARKLDDPEFAAEHPLLGGKAAAEAARKQAGQ